MNGSRNSILCPNCNRLISRNVARCPYCGIGHPGAWWKNNLLTKAMLDGEGMIKAIIYVNIAMYVISLLLGSGRAGRGFGPMSFLAPDNNSLFLLGASGAIPIERFHRYWTLLTANYLHGGILHIFFNMMAFYRLAPLAIQEYGTFRMFVIYTLTGVGGYLVSFMAGVPFTIGASASVCGLIGALLYYGKSRGGEYGQALASQVGGWVVGLFLFGFLVPGINNWAHGGGLLTGVGLAYLLGYRERKADNATHKMLAAACALCTVLALLWGIVSAFGLRFLA